MSLNIIIPMENIISKNKKRKQYDDIIKKTTMVKNTGIELFTFVKYYSAVMARETSWVLATQ